MQKSPTTCKTPHAKLLLGFLRWEYRLTSSRADSECNLQEVGSSDSGLVKNRCHVASCTHACSALACGTSLRTSVAQMVVKPVKRVMYVAQLLQSVIFRARIVELWYCKFYGLHTIFKRLLATKRTMITESAELFDSCM